jgi:hypothetical protein
MAMLMRLKSSRSPDLKRDVRGKMALDLDVRRGHYRAVTRGPSKYQGMDSY